VYASIGGADCNREAGRISLTGQRMTGVGQERRFGHGGGMSVCPPIAAPKRTSLDVTFGPRGDVRRLLTRLFEWRSSRGCGQP